METKRLRSIQTRQHTEDLVESCVRAQQMVPQRAYRVIAMPELSGPLRRLVRLIEREGSVWLAWADGGQMWLIAAEQSLELSRERGRPVLQMRVYDAQGDSQEAVTCVQTRGNLWERCA